LDLTSARPPRNEISRVLASDFSPFNLFDFCGEFD
jgi:hypothetical protein